ncbi:MAG: formylglycine-generating enzyme family protein, partial [Acidobacteriota bacterium]
MTTAPTPGIVVPPAPSKSLPPIIKGKDGRERVLIAAGEFLMGSDERDDEKPPHEVYLDAFYIDRYPVTNADYKRFADAA